MDGCDNLAISVAAGPQATEKALAATREFLLIAKYETDAGARLAIIVEELLLNIIEHGLPPAGDRIELTFVRTSRGTRLTIVDGGAYFDPRSAEAPGALPPERGGGAGIALIRSWAKILSNDRRDGRNHLLLELPD